MMTDVICPFCHSVTPPWRYCVVCNAALDQLVGNTPDYSPARRLKGVAGGGSDSAKTDKPSRQLDARLLRYVKRTREQGIRKLATSSTGENEVAVIAKVKAQNVKEFKELKSVREANPITESDTSCLITARIPIDRIEAIRRHEAVVSLKAAQRVKPLLERTVGEIGATRLPLRREEAQGSRDVIVGIVDFGLDLAYRNFRNHDGGTRILALWDQKAAGPARTPQRLGFGYFDYGALYLKRDIDEKLRAGEPYDALGYAAPADSTFGTGAHGTYVTDVAAGNGRGSNAPGVAPQADIVFVDISTAGILSQEPPAVGRAFGDSVQLLEAIKFIFDFAGDRPCVVNLSLGTNGGPHDGTTLVEEAIDAMIREKENRAVVVAAGNSHGEAIHAHGRVPAGGTAELRWRIPPFDWTGNELEIWSDAQDRFALELVDPDGRSRARVGPGDAWEGVDDCGALLTVVNRLGDPNNRGNVINVFFERAVREGVWSLKLYGVDVRDGSFHAWIERDEHGQSRFVKTQADADQIIETFTLNSIACGCEAIVVGAYNGYDTERDLWESSGSGPTRDGREKPDVSAPGERVLAAHSGTLVLRHRQTGTSLAAATVTGVVALMLAEAKKMKMNLTGGDIRKILTETAVKDPPDNGWHPRYGAGRVSASAALKAVRDLAKRKSQQQPKPDEPSNQAA